MFASVDEVAEFGEVWVRGFPQTRHILSIKSLCIMGVACLYLLTRHELSKMIGE